MVRRSEAEYLLRRARAFPENAEELYRRGRYDLAAFNLEQAAQLLLHAGDYPRTHSLHRLFRLLAEHLQDETLEQFYLENITVVGDLEAAYIAARYLPVEFEQREVEEMLRFVKKLFELLQPG